MDPWSGRQELARGVLRSSSKLERKPTKYLFFLPFETDQEILSSVLCTPATNCFFFAIHLASVRHISPVMCERGHPS